MIRSSVASETGSPSALVQEIESSQNLISQFKNIELEFGKNFLLTKDKDWLVMKERLKTIKYQFQISGHASAIINGFQNSSTGTCDANFTRRQICK